MKSRRVRGISIEKKIGSTLIAMTIIIFMIFLTLGMFSKSFMGKASATIASPQMSIANEQLVTNNMNEGDQGEYTFCVLNTKDTKRTEVSLTYAIYIETKEGYSGTINYQIYRETESGDKQITTKNSKGGYTDTSSQKLTEFGIESDEVHKYKIKFTPDKEGQFEFKVKVEAEQKD